MTRGCCSGERELEREVAKKKENFLRLWRGEVVDRSERERVCGQKSREKEGEEFWGRRCARVREGVNLSFFGMGTLLARGKELV